MAIAIVLTAEAVLHLLPSQMMLGYGAGLGTYYEVRHTIEDRGAADVAILGESRGQESILMPLLDKLVEQRLGREVYTANYSCPDAKSSDMLLITRQMISARTKPKLVLYLISPRGLHGNEVSAQRADVFGVFPNEYGHGTAQKLASFSEYPMWRVRNALEQRYYTFRYRYRFRYAFASILRGRAMLSPVQGEETTWQRYMPERSLLTNPISDEHIHDYVSRLLDEQGHYPLGNVHIEALREIARLCTENGSRLVLVNAPISTALARQLPVGVLDEFRAIVGAVAAEQQVRFLSSEDLGLEFDLGDFREQSHLNRRGAAKMTTALVERVIVPTLSAPVDSNSGTLSNGWARQ